MCLIGYSGYLTGFREPLSTSYICHTGLKSVLITGRVGVLCVCVCNHDVVSVVYLV